MKCSGTHGTSAGGALFFSVLACGAAVGLYFLLRSYMGMETVSWVCVLGAAPFAALGFVRYQWQLAKLSPNEYYGYITTGIYPLKGIVNESRNEHTFPITN